MKMMEELYQLVLERNEKETIPFVAIHESNATFLNQMDVLQAKCEGLERELSIQHEKLQRMSSSEGHISQAAALKNEAKLREKLERAQEELNEKLKKHSDEQAESLKAAKELNEVKDVVLAQETTISTLQKEIDGNQKFMKHMTVELEDAKSRTKLAEQQYMGLKDTIRILQEENDAMKKENMVLESRVISEKEMMSGEMNQLTELVDKLKKEVDMLRSLKDQDEKRKSWFGLASVDKKKGTPAPQKVEEETRKFGTLAVVVPSAIKQIVSAHNCEASCVRYDGSGTDLVATGGADSAVKVWDTANGALRGTLRGGGSNVFLSCDISDGLVAGGGSDKTCRVWNLTTQRMIHHLVGHAHKITCVRLVGGGKGVITGSADRSMKVWDISRQTYRQTTTMRHGSTANCVDIGFDSFTVVSAHLDGGIRFWDIRTGERTADISGLHEGAVTSVQFHPTDSSKVLTNGMDSCLKIVDIRTCTAIHTLRHAQFQTSYSYSASAFSPDGKFIASGSSSNGNIFVWDAETGNLKKKLEGHEAGVCGFAWGGGGFSGQQVASVDKNGKLILWA